MWNDEDNNPYGTSFDRRDSLTSSTANPTSPNSRECKLAATLATTSQAVHNDGFNSSG
jgi:hypothetical protein